MIVNEVADNDKVETKAMLAFVEVGPTSSGSTKLEDIVGGIEDLIPERMFDEFNEGDDEEQLHIFVEICDYLNEIAPEGVSFGASEGDGACYGFFMRNE
jgi:hypothetical protein